MSYLSFAKEMISNLFKSPVTTDYPLKPKQFVEIDRGRVINDIDKCIFCGSCQRNCPADAILVDRVKGTWSINPFSCVQCKACVDNCPKKCLSMDPHYTEPATEKKNIVMQGEPFVPPKPVPKPVATPVAKPAVEGAKPVEASKPAEAPKPAVEPNKPAEAQDVKNA